MTAEPSEIVALIPRLRRYARALTGNADQADDLVQDCLERALGRLQLWRSGTNLRAWLFTMMHNLHVNNLRRRAIRPDADPLPDWDAGGRVRPNQDDVVELRSVVGALRQLPDEQREVLLLVALEEMSYREVADTLGIPIGTVMSRLARGRERLRRLGGSDDKARAKTS